MTCCAICEDMIPEDMKRMYYDDPRAAIAHMWTWFHGAGHAEKIYILEIFNIINVCYHLVRQFPEDFAAHVLVVRGIRDMDKGYRQLTKRNTRIFELIDLLFHTREQLLIEAGGSAL